MNIFVFCIILLSIIIDYQYDITIIISISIYRANEWMIDWITHSHSESVNDSVTVMSQTQTSDSLESRLRSVD